MDSDGVLLPLIHEHHIMPWTDRRKANCCSRSYDTSDAYYCKICDFFVHKKCVQDASEFIQHSSHTHTLRLQSKPGRKTYCGLCGTYVMDLCYRCEICDFNIDLYCVKHPPPDVIDDLGTHHHKLTLLKELISFYCNAGCGKPGNLLYSFPYKCHECDFSFHVDCVWHPIVVNHSHHPLHTLKLYQDLPPPVYSDGKCRLCGTSFHGTLFYHCSSCNFSLDKDCYLNPPPKYLLDLKAHDHQLTLLPRLDSFTCNACGLKGDRSPYVCFQCGFMIHQDCLNLPRIIQTNRHDHRISRTSVLGTLDSACGVCRQKVDWTYGGFFCKKCPGYVVHSKCATHRYVWNGKELEDVPEETEDIEPYVVIDENTIQHFSHKEHHLRLQVNGLLFEDNKRCSACTHPIFLQSFYGCILGCDFILHQKCAEFPKKKWHVLHNEQLTLVTNKKKYGCDGCFRISNGFVYKHKEMKFDILCASISEPFFHPSHPNHPFYCIPQQYAKGSAKLEMCNHCHSWPYKWLRCIEDGCEFGLCFTCATLPQTVKHRIDDHLLSLCYGEKASGKYWCDICEEETNPETWFYTCKDHHASLHIECVLGDFAWLIPGSTIKDAWMNTSYEVVLNNSSSRPFCSTCKSHCLSSIILKMPGTTNIFFCCWDCEMLARYR